MCPYASWAVFFVSFAIILPSSFSINCYQCSGKNTDNPFQCNEWLDSDTDLTPESCDNVYDAKYCVKHIGRYEDSAIDCYQCSTSKNIDCSDGMIHLGGIEPLSCDNVFEAQYCIKSYSLDGGIGAKRFCSSVHLGNYCNYVKQPGDSLTYRTCVFTCTGDGCNPANTINPQSYLSLVTLSGVLLQLFFMLIIR